MGCACGKETIEINGRKYVVRSRVGEGGFSFVDLLEDAHSHKLLVAKRIATHSKEDERKARKEIDYHQLIDHANVIKCIAWTSIESTGFNKPGEVIILLPFYRRGTLQEELEGRATKTGHFSENRVLQLFQNICEGVEAMHRSKPEAIAHRDLKPGNVLLADDLSPVIMDLGSAGPARHEIRNSSEAKALEDFAAQHCSMLYRAPELFHVESHSSLDERTDVWSLGCLLYAICFFKSPFETAYERGDSIALAVIGGTIHIPENSPYSQGLHDLILSMLTVNAMERPFLETVLQSIACLLRRQTGSQEC